MKDYMRVQVKKPQYKYTLNQIWFLYGAGTIIHHQRYCVYSNYELLRRLSDGNLQSRSTNRLWNDFRVWYTSYLDRPEEHRYAVISYIQK